MKLQKISNFICYYAVIFLHVLYLPDDLHLIQSHTSKLYLHTNPNLRSSQETRVHQPPLKCRQTIKCFTEKLIFTHVGILYFGNNYMIMTHAKDLTRLPSSCRAELLQGPSLILSTRFLSCCVSSCSGSWSMSQFTITSKCEASP